MKRNYLYPVLPFVLACLVSCSQENSQQQMLQQAVAIERADECHLCGMLISNFPGPKAQMFGKQNRRVHKFCSTRDMFSFYLDPENKRNIKEIYVHDMSKMPWQALSDEHFINARAAWFVTNSSKIGAMGKTLASFSKQQDAQAFAEQFGGQVIDFDQVSMQVLM